MQLALRSIGGRSLTLALGLSGLLTLAPASARAADAKDVGVGVACALSNVVYGPTKLIYALLGSITAGFGYALTAGDIEVTRTILDTSVNGDYVVEPAHIRGEKRLVFVGSPRGEVPQDDWSTTQNSNSGF